jgi:hypothetical protein
LRRQHFQVKVVIGMPVAASGASSDVVDALSHFLEWLRVRLTPKSQFRGEIIRNSHNGHSAELTGGEGIEKARKSYRYGGEF